MSFADCHDARNDDNGSEVHSTAIITDLLKHSTDIASHGNPVA